MANVEEIQERLRKEGKVTDKANKHVIDTPTNAVEKQPSAKPTRKVMTATLAGALTTVAVAVAAWAGVVLDPVLASAIVAGVAGLAGYAVPDVKS